MPPKAPEKWQKIDIFLDITRKQRISYLEKIGLRVYYLVGSKEAKSDELSEIGVPF